MMVAHFASQHWVSSLEAHITVIIIWKYINPEDMRGDLHTLRKVCDYASVVMFAGEIAFIILILATLIFGGWSFADAGIRENFMKIIMCDDTDLALASRIVELTIIFAAMFVTVKVIHDIMVSIRSDNSPFMEAHADRFKIVSLTFLVVSVPLSILEYFTGGGLILAACVLLVCLLISVVMYCLTIIFRYGSMLQDESDHTL